MANKVSNEQLEALLEFLQDHPMSHKTVDRQWKQLAMKLNSIGSGSSKTGEHWKKYWDNIKQESMSRLSKRRRESFGTRGGPNTLEGISELDRKILSIIGEEAVFGDVEYRVPIFNYIENSSMETPQICDRSNIEKSEVVICEDTQTISAQNQQTLCPSTRGRTNRISCSETPVNDPSCSTTRQIPRSTLHRGSGSHGSRPVADRTFRQQYTSKNLKRKRINTRPSIDPEWIKKLEECRVEAEVRLANAASIMAEASRIQAEASANTTGIMAEAFRELAEASKMQAEASKIQAEASKMQAEAFLILKNMLESKS